MRQSQKEDLKSSTSFFVKTKGNDSTMKILVDAFGGDNAPLETIKGSIKAAEELGV